MSVQPGPTFKRYAANGVATVYAIPFLLLDAADLQITLNGVPVTSGFVLAGIGNPTSSCTFSSAPTGDLLFLQVIPFQRLADYQINGDFLADTVNDDFDRVWLGLKQVSRDSGRALTVDPLEPEGIPPLPVKALRSLRMLGFDAAGNAIPSNLTMEQIEQQPALALDAAATAAAAAVTSANNAASATASATLAQKWASNPEDNPVISGFFSALHWAAKAAASAAAAAGVLANAVLKTGAQTMAGPLTVTNGVTGIPFSKEFTSAELNIGASGTFSIAHGLGVTPKFWQRYLICKTAELGYSVGNVVDVVGFPDFAYSLGVAIVPDATNLFFQYGSQAGVFFVLNKSTGAVAAITPANWRLIVKAWA